MKIFIYQEFFSDRTAKVLAKSEKEANEMIGSLTIVRYYLLEVMEWDGNGFVFENQILPF